MCGSPACYGVFLRAQGDWERPVRAGSSPAITGKDNSMTSTEIVSSATPEQKRFAAAYLGSTCDELAAVVTDLSLSQASFRRQPDEWCISGIVEHLAIIEGRVQAIISRMSEATPAEPDRK